jgi:predicted RNase H-like HicB family nuclease
MITRARQTQAHALDKAVRQAIAASCFFALLAVYNSYFTTAGLLKSAGMSEIIFEVSEDEMGGGYVAIAPGHAIATQGESIKELREMVRDAVRCHFGDGSPGPMPKVICRPHHGPGTKRKTPALSR